MPRWKETKVYQLGEAIISQVSKPDIVLVKQMLLATVNQMQNNALAISWA